MNYLEQINKDLGGQNGLIYLMHLGRKTTGENIILELNKAKTRKRGYSPLADPQDQVYAATSFLTKKGYIYEVAREGRHKIRTAKLDPIIETLDQNDLPFNEKVIKITGKGLHVFPLYVSINFQARKTSLKHKDWDFMFNRLYKPFFTDLAAFAYGKILGETLDDNIIKTMSKLAVSFSISSKRVRKKVLEAFDTQTNLLETYTLEEVKELSKYVGSIYTKPLKNSLDLTPKEKKNFDIFWGDIFTGNFTEKQIMSAFNTFKKVLLDKKQKN
jgi:hypothetical protein